MGITDVLRNPEQSFPVNSPKPEPPEPVSRPDHDHELQPLDAPAEPKKKPIVSIHGQDVDPETLDRKAA